LRGLPHLQVGHQHPLFESPSPTHSTRLIKTELFNDSVRQPHDQEVCPPTVGLHHITWRATASGVANENIIADAVSWLVGDPENVEIEQTTSYHGSEVNIITGITKKKSESLMSLSRIGTKNIETLIQEIPKRFDQNNTLHFRIELNELIKGNIVLGQPGPKPTVKVHTKIEVYPGQNPEEECEKVLRSAGSVFERTKDDIEASN